MFNLRQLLNEVFVAFLFARDLARRAPNVRLAAVFAHQARRAAQLRHAFFGLFAARDKTITQLAVEPFKCQSDVVGTAIVFDAENIGDFV
ncbi:MAG: hypothetical protein JMDDDDMK_04241 [Acidobacteria bacterium]|nr:hypothetical protein [Acidobacteriota bacterium]